MVIFCTPCLICYQSNIEESSLPVYTPDSPCILKFPTEYLECYACISLILPQSEEPHNFLEMVLTNDKYKDCYTVNNDKELAFIINKEVLKLDFVGIKLVNEKDYTDDEDAYDIHTARFLLKIIDSNGTLLKSIKSGIMRNTNFDVSEEISVIAASKSLSKNYPNEIIIIFEKSIPYFPHEIEIKFQGKDEIYTPEKMVGFPIKKLHLEYNNEFDNTKLIVECPLFGKSWKYQPTEKIHSIEMRKMKKSFAVDIKSIENHQKLITEYVPFLIPEDTKPLKEKTKEICMVITYSKFKDGIQKREFGSAEDTNNIQKVFSEVLKYDVKILENLTTKDLKEEIEDIIEDYIKVYHQNVVIFILSHGFDCGFCTYDGQMPLVELVNIFFSKTCKISFTQEKLIFASFCLGNKINGINLSTDDDILLGPKFVTKNQVSNRPKHCNIFIGYSTLPGYQSMRAKSGTLYIQELMETIEEKPEREVRKIHQITQQGLAKKVSKSGHYSVASSYDCLIKNSYFKR